MIGNPANEQRKLLRNYGILIMHTPKYNQGSPLRSLLRDDILVGIAPDGTINPFWDMMMITSQQTSPDENITREQAVIAYTKTNAYAEFKEKLPVTRSLLTMIDGKIVYRSMDME